LKRLSVGGGELDRKVRNPIENKGDKRTTSALSPKAPERAEVPRMSEVKRTTSKQRTRDRGQKTLDKAREAFLARNYSRGFIEYCQFQAEVIQRGYFEATVGIQEHHRQQDGFIHAGVMATLADHTAGYAAFTTVPEEFQILTIEFKINFLRPGLGRKLICRSRVIREGSQLIISESEVFDQRDGDEVLVAKALVTLMPVHRDKLSRKR
jgi:uncharacterized protein (TIGR00369 family)